MPSIEENLSRAAAKKLISSLDQVNSENFEQVKMPENLIACLALLNFTQQHSLIKKANEFITITVDVPALEMQLELIEKTKEQRELIDDYLLRGAPRDLMRRLFGIHSQEFSRRRTSLGLAGISKGRPSKRDEALDLEIWSNWKKYDYQDEKTRFLTLSKLMALDLHIIWSSLREHLE